MCDAFVTVVDTIPYGTTLESITVPPGWSGVTPPVGGTGTVYFSGQIAAGASLVQIYTGFIYQGPSVIARANAGIAEARRALQVAS